MLLMKGKCLPVLWVLSLPLVFANLCAVAQELPASSIVFHQGMSGYHTFRIPAVVQAADGAVLAFAEARKDTGKDEGHIELVMRKSADGGKTWGRLQVVWADAPNVCGNPSPVVDRRDGTIYLLCCWGHGADGEQAIITNTSKYGRKIFILTSKDNGESWSEPREITPMVKRDNWTWYATGPGHAMQLYNKNFSGRIIVPCDHGVFNGTSSDYSSHIIYSDDKGVTWHIGAEAKGGNESMAAELANGDIMLNMRWQPVLEARIIKEQDRYRRVGLSRDGGRTFYKTYVDSTLVEPICQGAIETVRGADGKPMEIVLFSNPATQRGRRNLTLRMSEDSGRTWAHSMLIAKLGAYSDIVVLRDGTIGVLCETGFVYGHENISFFRTDIESIKRQKN